MSPELVSNDEGTLCEEVKWHTRKKHAFLGQYLKIWTDRVGNKKNSIPFLDIADLYASTGMCFCEDINEAWKGSALLAAECLEKYKGGNRLFLNTYHPSEGTCLIQREGLEKNLSHFLGTKIKTKVTTLPVEKAVNEAKNYINPRFPNIWILDPYRASDLPWSVVKEICMFKGYYLTKDGKEVSRRPELFINLLTSGMQRNIDNSPRKISISLGLEEEEWRPRLNELIKEGLNNREALISIYTSQLLKYYEKPPIVITVNDNTEKAIVYCLFLCTDSNAGHYVTKLLSLPEYEKWRQYEWKPEAEKINLLIKNGKEQKSLLDF